MIFLDNASTTQCTEECAELVKEYLLDKYFNPSAPYHNSLELSREIKNARLDILRQLKGDGNLIFTSSGSESDNLALFGSKKINGSRIIISATEHPAILNSALELKQRGFDLVMAEVDEVGRVDKEKFCKILTKDTSLVSIMHVNNETGCINDIKELVKIAKSINPEVIFHSDGVQAVGKIKVSLTDLGVDLYSISGHKIHAPKGVGALYVKNGINLKPIIYGGGQEDGIRSSTENVAGICALKYSIEQAYIHYDDTVKKLSEFKELLLKGLPNDIKFITDNNCSAFIFNMAMPYIRGEVMLHSLEKYGIMVGTGSACSSKKGTKRLPMLLQLSQEYADGLLRISFSRFTTKDDIEYFIKCFNLEYIELKKYIRG